MRTPLDLTALGLTSAQSAVLAGIAEQGVSTAVHLSGRLALSAESVSRALTALCDMGLVVRGTGRPRPVRLHPDLENRLLRIREELLAEQRRRRQGFDRARQALVQLTPTGQWLALPTPALAPVGRLPNTLAWQVRGMRTSWDEILVRESPVLQTRGWLAAAVRKDVRVRLLVCGPAPAPRVVRAVQEMGVTIRCTSDDVAPLVIVDGSRARVPLLASNATRHGWTDHPGQVRLLQDGFDSAWARGSAGAVTAA